MKNRRDQVLIPFILTLIALLGAKATFGETITGRTFSGGTIQGGNEYVDCTFTGTVRAEGDGGTVRNSTVKDGGCLKFSGNKRWTIAGNEFIGASRNVYFEDPPFFFEDIDGFTIERNTFRDNPSGYAMIGFGFSNTRITRNRFDNLQQGAHLLKPLKNNELTFNVFTRLIEMGFEVQRHGGSQCDGQLVEGNVVYDWRESHTDGFGLSIVPDLGLNVRIVNNYIEGLTGPGKEQGFPIEAGFRTGVVEGNVIAGERFKIHIVVSHKDTLVKNNRMYGRPRWGSYVNGEPGPDNGHGNAIEQNNLKDPSFANRPPRPDPLGGPTPPPNPPPAALIALDGFARSSTVAELTWVRPSGSPAVVSVRSVSTRGREPVGGTNGITAVPAGATVVQVKDLQPNWEIDFELLDVAGKVVSTAKTIHMPRATPPPPTQPTNPPPPPTQPAVDPIEEVTVKQRSGKTTTVKP